MRPFRAQSKGYKIEKHEDARVFWEKVKNFDAVAVECTDHTLFRLSKEQRKEFTCNTLKNFLLNEIPLRVGVQINTNYAAYYKYSENRIIKIIVAFHLDMARIVTFKILGNDQLPRR